MEITSKSIFMGEGLRLSVGNQTIAEIWHHTQGYWYAVGNTYFNGWKWFNPSHDLSYIGSYNLTQLLEELKNEICRFFNNGKIEFTNI